MPSGVYERTKPVSYITRKKLSDINKGNQNAYKTGQYRNYNGRILILAKKHPNSSKNGYIMRSRLVMEKKLGQYLELKEIVHHINGIVDDDRPENLQLFPNRSSHMKFHRKIKYWSNKK